MSQSDSDISDFETNSENDTSVNDNTTSITSIINVNEYIAVCCYEMFVPILDSKTLKLQTIITHESIKWPITSVASCKEHPQILCLGSNERGLVWIFDIEAFLDSGEGLIDILEIQGTVQCMAMNSNGVLAIGSKSLITLFDLTTNEIVASFSDVHYGNIHILKFHPLNNNLLMSGGSDYLVCLLNLDDPDYDAETSDMSPILHIFSCGGQVSFCEFTGPELSYVTTVTDDNLFGIFSLENGDIEIEPVSLHEKIEKQYLIGSYLFDYTPLLISADVDGSFMILQVDYDTETNKIDVLPTMEFQEHIDLIRCSLFQENLNELITTGDDCFIIRWDLSTQKVIAKVNLLDELHLVDH
eukprot:TRINITY_DN921_c0_g1_i1.p1 TRINITY_DN921_c0_g1~~TRINITY_DN921_c0_g1_i1.p1  ORF type:complete len:365 (-),score=103.50 TRINITY_DN921_c0_g1_i1:93-1160(-)